MLSPKAETRPDDLASATSSTPERVWQILAEFSLPGELSTEHLGRVKLAEAVQGLNLPVTNLERLNVAVARAILNAIDHGHRPQFEASLMIRILISNQAQLLRIINRASDGLLPEPETPDLASNLADQELPQGWGFFLIEKRADDPPLRGEEAHHTIELFLYLEGG